MAHRVTGKAPVVLYAGDSDSIAADAIRTPAAGAGHASGSRSVVLCVLSQGTGQSVDLRSAPSSHSPEPCSLEHPTKSAVHVPSGERLPIDAPACSSMPGVLPCQDGVRVRLANGQITVVDGPFTESQEVIGGWAILRAESKTEATRVASEFMELHYKHWPEFESACEVRSMFEPGAGCTVSEGPFAETKQ
jgi:hypothetical protein